MTVPGCPDCVNPYPAVYAVWDRTTANLLGEFDTRAEAEAWVEEIRPFGRYGPDGHDLVVTEEEAEDV